MKNLKYIILGISLAVSFQVFASKVTPHIRIPTKTTTPTATSTLEIDYSALFNFGTNYTEQGACIRIKDTGGSGYTFLTTLNGQGLFSKVSCE